MFYSITAYEFVRKELMKVLPHPQTIRTYFRRYSFKPGICIPVLESVKIEIEKKKFEGISLKFGLQVDEMSIKKCIEIYGTSTYGFVDLGSETPDCTQVS